MIKTILVPATGGDGDILVFASALTVARRFGAHLEFLHVRPDAAATAVNMAADGGGATMVGGLITRLEEEADQREKKADQQFLLPARGGRGLRCPARAAWPVGSVAPTDRCRSLLGHRIWTRRRPLGHRAPGQGWFIGDPRESSHRQRSPPPHTRRSIPG